MKNKPRRLIWKTSLVVLLAGGFFLSANIGEVGKSANLTSVSVTLSNSRLSFVGRLDNTNAEGVTSVNIQTTGAGPSFSTNQLQVGDAVTIGDGATMSNYNVTGTNPNAVFTIDTGLDSNDYQLDDFAIASQSSQLSVAFATVNTIADGSFRVLVPTNTDGEDGIPNGGGFDYGTGTPVVTCPSNGNGYTFGTATSAPSATTVNGITYHEYVCPYTGTPTSPTQSFTSNPITIANVINPAPASGHTAGSADTYRIILQHRDSNDVVVDQTAVSVGVIEAVKVTAEVPPQISFSIAGVNSSTAVCGSTTDVTTYPTSVPFGELLIDVPRIAAQQLSVNTNALGGYVVTAAQSDQLGMGGQACPDGSFPTDCIPDSPGDNNLMSHTVTDTWSNAGVYGFGFTMQAGSGSPPAVPVFTNSNGYRRFADLENSEVPQQIFSYSTVTNTQSVYSCYRLNISAIQPAGAYENYITYRATATF